MNIFGRARAGLIALFFVMMAAVLPMSAATAQTIDSMSPTSGPEGTEVTVTGSGFRDAIFDGQFRVRLADGANSRTAFVVSRSPTSFTFEVPILLVAGTSYEVIIEGDSDFSLSSSTSTTPSFTVTATPPPPTINGFLPSTGSVAGGTSVTIIGQNLNDASRVTFDGADATITSRSSTQLVVTTPPRGGATAAQLRVTTPGGTVPAQDDFIYVETPTITSVEEVNGGPPVGSIFGGDFIRIIGTNFLPGSTVTIGGVSATSVVRISDTRLNATVPPRTPAGPVDVTVTTDNGSETAPNSFTYVNPPAPTITSVTKVPSGAAEGPTSGDTQLDIFGNNLDFVTGVTFAGVPGTAFQLNFNSIRVTTPAGASGGAVNVVVESPYGNTTVPNGFTYISEPVAGPPTITSFSPSSAPMTGGTTVTVTGTNFVNVQRVRQNGQTVPHQVLSPTQLTFVTNASSDPGDVFIQVVTAAGFPSDVAFPLTPVITSVAPPSGSAAGGTSVIITGNGFRSGGQDASAVRFGSNAATSFTVNSATQITAQTPSGSAGAVSVSVTSNGLTVTSAGAFTYVVPPQISFMSNNTGPISGGTVVGINGSGFTAPATVTFGTTPSTNVVVSSSNLITAEAPPGAAGQVSLVVTTAGLTLSLPSAFTYQSTAPIIGGLSPNSGTSAGGSRIFFSGLNLTNVSAVTFGGVPALYFLNNGPSLTAFPPPGLVGAVDVVVTTSNGSTTSPNAFTYVDPASPIISGFSQSSGVIAGGNTARLFGTNFTGATDVTIGGISATFTVLSASQISVVIPAASSTGRAAVTVTTPAGTATVPSTSNAAYNYVGPPPVPTITSVTPSTISVDGGATVTINGNSLITATSVTFNGVAGSSIGGTGGGISVIAPAGTTGPVTIAVTNPSGTVTSVNATNYVADPLPVITSISPTSAANSGGTTLTITGSNFTGATAVTFSGLPGVSPSVVSPTQMTVVTPNSSGIGNVALAIASPGGTSASVPFTLTNSAFAAATVSGASPSSGTIAGGTSVTITGTNFSGATAVRFGAVAATSYVVNSPTQITAIAPAGSAGATDIAVTTLGGTVTSAGAFTYTAPQQPAPTITSVAPTSGTTAGGTSVVITGTNFIGTPTVAFGSTAATSVTVISATQITAVAPAGSAGAVNVAVTTSAGTATSNSAFTYVAGQQQQSTPTITAVSPNSGTTAGGTSVVITGTNFIGTPTVAFGSTAATSVTVNSATQITAVAPAGSAGTVNVAVTTSAGTATSNSAFTYVATPAAPSVTARSGVAVAFNSQGTVIDLTSSVSGVASTISIVTPPARGTATVAGKVVTYTPTAGYYGTDSFTFTATGPGGTSAPATVSLTVAGASPQVQPQSGSVGDGEMVSIELTRGATFGPFTAATVVSVSPADAAKTVITSTGEGASRRFFLEATAAPRFGGTVSINYTLTNAFGVSPVGVVTLTVAARADPSKDPRVVALSDAQVQATRRFGRSQIANFMRRNEQLHSGRARSSQNVSVNVIDPTRERRPEDSMAPTAMPKRDSDRAAEEDAKEATATAAADAASTAPAVQDEKPAGVLGAMSMWVSGAVDIATRDASSFAPKLSATTQGISGGVDFQISKRTAIGFGGGYGYVTTDINDKAAELRASSNLVAVYGSTKLFENGFVDVVAGRGFLDYKTRRRIDGTELTALGTRSGTMNLAAVSFGINKQVEDLDWSFYSKLEYMDAKLAAYTETSGGSRNNLRLSALDDTSYSAGLGFRLQKAYATGIGQVTPRLRGEFGREFGKADVQYVDYADIAGATTRGIQGRNNEQNFYQTSIGTMIDLKDDWSFDLEYALMYNTATLSSGIKVQVSRAF